MATWVNLIQMKPHAYKCGYCDKDVGSAAGLSTTGDRGSTGFMSAYVCPNCDKPTFFMYQEQIAPRPRPGEPVEALPEKVEAIYQEARSAMQAGAYTGATLLLRSLLAHVAVEKGGDAKATFAQHVTFLVTKGILPSTTAELLDAIRVAGNEVAHDLVIATEDDVLHLMTFATHALRSVYELPAKLTQLKAKP